MRKRIGRTELYERDGIGVGVASEETQDGRKVDDFLRTERVTCSCSTCDEYEKQGDRNSTSRYRGARRRDMFGGYLYGYDYIAHRSGHQAERILGIVTYNLIQMNHKVL